MRSIRLAEWILSLVTAPVRAASTAGDLVEERSTRGPIWFWNSVLRTVASHVWRGIAEAPARVAGVAFLGAVIEVAAGFLWAFLSGIMFFFAGLWFISSSRQPSPSSSIHLKALGYRP